MAKKKNNSKQNASRQRRTKLPEFRTSEGRKSHGKKGAAFAAGSTGGVPNLEVSSSPAAIQMERYIAASLNPFDSPVGCMPKSPGQFSSKHKVWAKATAAVGTAGFGFALSKPTMASDGGSTGTNNYALTISDGTYTGTTTRRDTAVVGVTGAEVNSPFVVADFGNSALNGRMIARGLRIRYIGTELNRGGRVIAFYHPNGETLSDKTVADVLAYPTAKTVPVTRSWQAVVYHPVHESETDFSVDPDGPEGQYNLAILFEGTAGNQFEVELYSHFEVIGPKLGTSITESYADDSTFSKVQSYLHGLSTSFYDSMSRLGNSQQFNNAVRRILLEALRRGTVATMIATVRAQGPRRIEL